MIASSAGFHDASRHSHITSATDTAPGDLARLRAEHAEAFALAGAWTEAVDLYRRALSALEEHGLAWESARARLGLGRALARMGELDKADAALTHAAEQFQSLNHATGHARSLLLRAELAMMAGHPGVAQPLLNEALAKLEDRPADLDGSGSVGVSDLLMLLANWG